MAKAGKKRKAAKAAPARTAVQFPPVIVRFAGAALAVLFLVHVAVFGGRVTLAERNLSHDSFHYVVTARNLSEGRGFAQSSPGNYGFWAEQFSPDFPPQTRHTHSVGYPLLIFAAAEATGLAHGDAAFLVGALAYAAVLALAFALGFRIWGIGAGLLGVAVVVSPPQFNWLRTDWLFSWAWTEPAATAGLLGTLVLLAKNPGKRAFLAAGVLAGLAILIRSAMLPLVGVGILAAMFCGKSRWKMSALFLVGASIALVKFAVGEGTVYALNGPSVLGPNVLASRYFSTVGGFFLVLAALATAAYWRGAFDVRAARGKRTGESSVSAWRRESGGALLFAGVAGFSILPFATAAVVNIDAPWNDRLMYPAKVAAAALGAGLAWRALPDGRWRTALAAGIFALALAGGIARDREVLAQGRDVSDAARSARSAMLLWAKENVGENDFVIGAAITEFPYYLPRITSAVVVYGYPYSPVVGEDKIAAIVRHRCGRFDNFYMFAKRDGGRYGPYLDGLISGKPAADAVKVAEFADGAVYRLTHCDGAGAE